MTDDQLQQGEPSAEEDLTAIVDSARRLGVELNETEALAWLSAMAAQGAGIGGDVTFDTASGVYGHRVTMLDFSPTELARFRQIAEIVGFEDRPGQVETALALSGSAAQSRIQTYPGDCDYFERVNILAPTREEACRILAEVVRDKALATRSGPTHRLIEVKFGSYPADVVRRDVTLHAGGPVTWYPADIEAGRIDGFTPSGEPTTIEWLDVAEQPGWVKLDWVVADPIRRRVANASNMLDVTWEAPDGAIVPLDGWLDSYYQEVYLEASSIPVFSKLAKHVMPDALDDYVEQLQKEVRKYATGDHPNFGKVAKRMYNVFRLTGRYEDAAYIRELFDEPTSVLYQVLALIRTVEEAIAEGSTIDVETVMAQADELILASTQALEGAPEAEVVGLLLHFRDAVTRDPQGTSDEAHAAQEAVSELVNAFFKERLMAVPSIQAYLDEVTAEQA